MYVNRLYQNSNITDYAIPAPPPEVFLKYTGPLLEKYKLDDKLYHSTTTGSIFENIISYVRTPQLLKCSNFQILTP